jgi:multidrug efflux pump subunit AcrB
MTRFNLSEWAVNNKAIVVFLMLLCAIAGVGAYERLGRQEDPDFSVQTMVVQVAWPGATALDTMKQVTDRLEKKLEETPRLDYIKSYTKPGQSTIFVYLKESTPKRDLPDIWYQVRKKVSDIQATLPKGVIGPFFNDEFGDVFGIVYGITYDGFTPREARDFAETARAEFLRSPDVGKVEIFGAQDEKIYLDFSPQKLANLKLNLHDVLTAVAQQNAVVPSGVINTAGENVLVDVTGALLAPQSIANLNLSVNGRFYKLTDIAEVRTGYSDPPTKMFRVNGKPAIGIGVNMASGGKNLTFGKGLHEAAQRLMQRLPIGIELNLVSDQPEVVKEALGSFTKALFEAIAIVLLVSFLSLGLRAGVVVALSIPLVLAIVFVSMKAMDISLQRISLGALIIALGLLVDDAMITIEMMISKIEEGMEKVKAATFAYTSTAFPMLTGTLITIFGFLPIGFADNNTGQYTFSLFAVIAVALVASWFVAVIFAPVIGLVMLPARMKAHHAAGPGRFMRAFGWVLGTSMRHPWLTITASLIAFGVSVYGLGFVQQQFFPASNRPELLVTMSLPKNASIAATQAQTERLEKTLASDPDISRFSAYVGGGAIRFYLPLDVQLDNDFMAEIVVVAKGLEARDRVLAKLETLFATDFPDATARISRLELGPPVGWPVQYRVSAPTADQARHYADQIATTLRASGLVRNVNYDWAEKSKELRIVVDQDRVRQAGLSSEQLAQALNRVITGATITQVRDSIYLIDVVARAQSGERSSFEALRNLQITTPTGASVPLRELASFHYELDEGYVWRRGRLPTVTVQAVPLPGLEPASVNQRLGSALEALRASMPAGTLLQVGGTVEKSEQSNAALLAQVPLMIALMLTVLMFQLGSFRQLGLVISVAPLGLIGVVAALLTTGTPMGFIAILGVVALAGMIIRNSVILVDQIEHERARGVEPWEAVIEATKHRFRPIMLTAAAAILGMIPIMHDTPGLTRARAARLIALADISVAPELAASPGDPRAIFALAETYDPNMLSAWRVRGIRSDRDRANALYGEAPKHGRDRFALTSADQGAFESTG